MARRLFCRCRSRYGRYLLSEDVGLTLLPGPAHAVYFGTYEIVKEYYGGNKQDGKHHPLAAGEASDPLDVIAY